MVAALFVARDGVYYGLPSVDPWPIERDARRYAGPHVVVAHPPCARWGRYWHGGPNSARYPRARQVKGADGGCFLAALRAVQRYGGVIEHPAASAAWAWHGLLPPMSGGGWCVADWYGGGWTCQVEQGHYGHRARKATWLLVYGARSLPSLTWGPSTKTARLDDGYHTAEERARATRGKNPGERLTHTERAATPIPFRDLLLEIARSCTSAT